MGAGGIGGNDQPRGVVSGGGGGNQHLSADFAYDTPQPARKVEAEMSEQDVVGDLKGWWEQTAHDEVTQLVNKMVEYGGLSRATDLTEIGRHMAEAGVETPQLMSVKDEEEYLQELGIYFYIVGKMARWSAAVKEGRSVSDDTLLDIGIYVRMAQRARKAGGWPV